MSRRWVCWLVLFGMSFPAPAAPPAAPRKPSVSDILPLLSAGSPDALAGAIRGALLRTMPQPLYEAWPGWGETDNVVRGIKWKGLKPKLQYSPRNDGHWRHIRVTALEPANTLVFDIRDVQQREAGRLTFTAFLSFDARADYEHQRWQNGIRLYSTGARARFRVRAALQCEATWRVEMAGLLPELIYRFRVVHANVNYDNFKLEHVLGMGGEAAETMGELFHAGLHRWHPSLERDLLGKVNAAIEKAADTREVRLSLSELLKKKGWWPKTAPKNLSEPPPPEPPPASLGQPVDN